MKIESCDFMQAVEILAKSVGMDVPNFSVVNNDGIEKRKKEKDQILNALNLANQHYQQNLYKDFAKPAQEYVKKRLLTKRELDNFGLGYSANYSDLVNFLKSKGVSEDIMEKAGLVKRGEKGCYDVFAYRLTFPLYNIYSECVGFSARILTNDKTKAKYQNSPTTMVFDKSKTVFGLNLVRQAKQKETIDKVIVVEGQMDVIAMHKAGFKNAVACLGTAFTQNHAKQLKLISDNVVVCLDGDGAGQKATFKIVDILAENGFNVRVVKNTSGKDPDEYIKDHGIDAMKKLIDSAEDYIDFQIDYLAKDVDFSMSDEKARFVRNSLKLLEKLKTNSERQIYLKHIKTLSGVPTDVLQQDIYSQGTMQAKVEEQQTVQNMEDGSNRAIKFILASMMYKKEYSKNHNIKKFLHNNTYIKLYDLIDKKINSGTPFTVSSLYDEFDFDSEPNLVDIVNYNFEENGNNEKYYQECMWSLTEKYLKNEQSRLNAEFANSKDTEERKKILIKISEITKKLKNKEMEE